MDEEATGGFGNAPPVESVEGCTQSVPEEAAGMVVGVVVSADGKESELVEGDSDTPEISSCQLDDVQPSSVERDVGSAHSMEAPDIKDDDLLVYIQSDDALSEPTIWPS